MRIRPIAVGVLPLALLLAGCPAVPRCAERVSGGHTEVVIRCNAGQVPVCGDKAAQLYDPMTGALLPVPPDGVASGSCQGFGELCRPRPRCSRAGAGVQCPAGYPPRCVLGLLRTLTPDGAPVPRDGGSSRDAGAEGDAGGP